MIAGVDSKPPTDATLKAAKIDGIRLWGLYHGVPGDGIDPGHLASDADFARVKAAGYSVIAYVSGNDDPAAIRAWSQATGVPCALDVERFIRPDGLWVPSWLATSGSGLYGNLGVHKGRRAAFYILADYPGFDPKATWLPGVARPPGPCAWQFQGTTAAYGTSIDRSWFDDAFAGKFSAGSGSLGGDSLDPNNPTDAALIYRVNKIYDAVTGGFFVDNQGYDKPTAVWAEIKTQFADLATAVAKIPTSSPTPVDVSALQTQITDLQTAINKLSQHLGEGVP